MEIIGFDHDDLADGSGKAPYTFATKHLMADTHIINAATSDYDDFYRGTDMYDFLETTVYSILPSELKSFIKAASKLFTTNSYGSSENMHASAKLWLLSTAEIGYEEDNYRPVGEGVRYARFTGDSSRIKKIANGTGAASKWWTRTPFAMNMWADYWRVNEDGADTIQAHGSVTDSLGVCFGFCV